MDLLVFSHLRWDFVYQRPQHLISRFARDNAVWFFEEPIFDAAEPRLEISTGEKNLHVCVPHLAPGTNEETAVAQQKSMIDDVIAREDITHFATWYYTPMAISFTRHLQPLTTVYDCMDELSAFRGAPPGLCAAEQELFRAADLVFTGGQSLYESKRHQHSQVFAFPSSIDAEHFQAALHFQSDAADQANTPHPRIGFAGVIDERLDIELLGDIAQMRPEWQFVLLGPVVKIREEDLPRSANLHYLGPKPYASLPEYMAGWDIGMMPFARNEATRFISPTKTPEYLAAGLPVVSTSIRDVVRPYGENGLVEIADGAEQFVAACERLLKVRHDPARLAKTKQFLARNSWDITWKAMNALLNKAVAAKTGSHRQVGAADARMQGTV